MTSHEKRFLFLLLGISLLSGIGGAALVHFFAKSEPVQIDKTEIVKLQTKFDSLTLEFGKHKIRFDSAMSATRIIDAKIITNHNKLKNDTNQVDKFTNDSRNRWNDSILKVSGLR